MSRIGKDPIKISEGVTVEVANGGDFGHQSVTVSGPKGQMTLSVRKGIDVKVEDGIVTLSRKNESKINKSFHGLYRAMIANMVYGLTEGFSKELEIVGIGYRAEQQGDTTVFSVGYSHPIAYKAPEGITISVADQVNVKVEGYDKQKVGEVAAKIRAFRKPEPYKGKGIRYKGEIVRRKSAKSTSK